MASSAYNPSYGEESLWVAVIAQAVADACWVDPYPLQSPSAWVMFMGSKIRRKKANRIRDEAIFWFTMDNADFRKVCEYAGLEPSKVRRWARRALDGSDEDKAKWAAAGLSVRGVQTARELRAGGQRA